MAMYDNILNFHVPSFHPDVIIKPHNFYPVECHERLTLGWLEGGQFKTFFQDWSVTTSTGEGACMDRYMNGYMERVEGG